MTYCLCSSLRRDLIRGHAKQVAARWLFQTSQLMKRGQPGQRSCDMASAMPRKHLVFGCKAVWYSDVWEGFTSFQRFALTPQQLQEKG